MRKAPSGSLKIHAFDGPIRDCRQFSDFVGGPFYSEADFNERFVLDLLNGTPRPIRHALIEALGSTNNIVFTYSDLTPRNVIIEGNRVKGLLDWEYAGWYPEYWEFIKFFERPTNCKDWKDYASIIFETEYRKALITFQALARWQKP